MTNTIRTTEALSPGRVGSVVCWRAQAVAVSAGDLRAALRKTRRTMACPRCGAVDGQACDSTVAPVDADGFHEERAGVLAGRVRDPVDDAAAMTRAIARQRKSENGLSWRRGTPDPKAPRLAPIALVSDASVTTTTTTGDAVAVARWTLVHDESTGAVVIPPGLGDDEQEAVGQLLARYDVERTMLTAVDVTAVLVGICNDLGGFSLNGGGTYFVPRDGDEVVEACRTSGAFESAGYRLTVADLAAGRADNVRDAAEDSLLAAAREIEAEAKKARDKMDAFILGEAKGKPRSGAVTERLAEIEALRRRGRALARVLGAQIAGMEAALDDAKASSDKVLDDLSLVG
ncbi:MAG: hypothetical protein FJ096_02600 [Deltaproteobacteria bacterium]|nr:hypothetical protein [Deltaproteobacteria bacterium]